MLKVLYVSDGLLQSFLLLLQLPPLPSSPPCWDLLGVRIVLISLHLGLLLLFHGHGFEDLVPLVFQVVHFKFFQLSGSHLCIIADDVALLASWSTDLQLTLGRFTAESEAAGMKISSSKSEAVVLSLKRLDCPLWGRGRVSAPSGGVRVSQGLLRSEGEKGAGG